MHEKLDKGIFFGMAGNLLFVAFSLICAVYYVTYDGTSTFSKVLEVIAYCTEFMGFGLLVYSEYLLCVSVRLRNLMKISYGGYIALEAVIMLLELNSNKLEFYKPFSMALAIIHAVVSGLACFAFLQLDPDNTRYEVSIVVCIAMVFCGMLGSLMGMRVYFSVLVNALSFTGLFGIIRFWQSRQEIDIDCYGDSATVREYNSTTLFKDPTLSEDSPAEETTSAEDASDDKNDE